MSAPKHTPGPWFLANPEEAKDEYGVDLLIRRAAPGIDAREAWDNGERRNIASVWSIPWTWNRGAACGDEELANARLISAAPEMFEALLAVYERLGELPTTQEDTALAIRVHSAIVKAGGTPGVFA